MATTYTTNLELATPTTGELAGTWGDVVNDQITTLVEEAITGIATITGWAANVHTLSTAQGSTAEARCAILDLQDAAGLTAAGTLNAPDGRTKIYIVVNNTSYAVTVQTVSGTGISVPSGETMWLYSDGTNILEATNTYLSAVTTANLTATTVDINGGTIDGTAIGATTPAAGNFSTVDIDGGTIDGTTVGATAPSTGAFTTLSASTSVTTANLTATGTTTLAGASTTADITFGDNDKAIFGAGSDLQIYHDGSHSQIRDAGTGNLYIKATSGLLIQDNDTGTNRLTTSSSGPVYLYHAGDLKLATTSTGVDVTGTATMDGLTVSGGDALAKIEGTGASVILSETDATDLNTRLRNTTGDFLVQTINDAVTAATDRIRVDHATGDISFYDSLGVSQSFFWDASAESLGIGTSSPSSPLDVTVSDATIYSPTAVPSFDTRISNSDTTVGASAIQGYLVAGASGTGIIYQGAVGGGSSSSAEYVIGARTGSGSYAERLRIDSSGNVGIGTSSPAYAMDISQTSNSSPVGLRLQNSEGSFILRTNANQTLLDAGTDILFRNSSESERMRIDSSGNVGIGTSSPADALHISNSSATDIGIRLDRNSAERANLQAVFDGAWLNGAQVVRFATGDTERARIDSSGNLLVGKTSSSNAVAGTAILANGAVEVARVSDTPLKANRLTSDGIIADFRKDGTSVGSIGSSNSDLMIGNSDVGLKFHDVNNKIYPWDVGTDTISDGAISLGDTSGRFKDLYLSGGVYLGGTVAANKLDDYETGTFTPTVGGTWSTSPTALSGTYTKIGNTVHVTLAFTNGAKASEASGWIAGLPFAINRLGTAVCVNSTVSEYGSAFFANTDRVWLTANSFTANYNYISGFYTVA